LLDRLGQIVGPDDVVTGSALLGFTSDWSGRFTGEALAAVRPKNTEQVAAVIRVCAEAGVAVIPQGGNTGLVGGSVPYNVAEPCIVLVLTKLQRLDAVDTANNCVVAGAGVTIARLRAHAQAAGFEYGVDLAARDSATVGGTVATDAGGVRVVYWGTTRAQVLGLEVVGADGEIVDALGAVEKDGAGYDISAALVGSEGTLGVITAARLRLHSPLPELNTFLIGCKSWGHAREIFNKVAKSGVRVLAAEALDLATMQTVREVNSLPPALTNDWPVYLLLELDGVIDMPEDLEATMAMDANDRLRLWRYREEASVSISTHPNVHKMDVSLPVQHLDDFTKSLAEELPKVAGVARWVVFGHVAEGNLHVDVAGPEFEDFEVDEVVYRLAAKFAGSVASEHGVGRVKPHLLELVRQPSYMQTIKRVKSAWDPNWLLNPGVLVLRD